MMEKTTNDLVQYYRDIKQDYAYEPDIMSNEDDRVTELKRIISTKLNAVDRTIILLYADCQSYRKLGEKMKLSHMTIRREIKRIQAIILSEYKKIHEDIH